MLITYQNKIVDRLIFAYYLQSATFVDDNVVLLFDGYLIRLYRNQFSECKIDWALWNMFLFFHFFYNLDVFSIPVQFLYRYLFLARFFMVNQFCYNNFLPPQWHQNWPSPLFAVFDDSIHSFILYHLVCHQFHHYNSNRIILLISKFHNFSEVNHNWFHSKSCHFSASNDCKYFFCFFFNFSRNSQPQPFS